MVNAGGPPLLEHGVPESEGEQIPFDVLHYVAHAPSLSPGFATVCRSTADDVVDGSPLPRVVAAAGHRPPPARVSGHHQHFWMRPGTGMGNRSRSPHRPPLDIFPSHVCSGHRRPFTVFPPLISFHLLPRAPRVAPPGLRAGWRPAPGDSGKKKTAVGPRPFVRPKNAGTPGVMMGLRRRLGERPIERGFLRRKKAGPSVSPPFSSSFARPKPDTAVAVVARSLARPL
ncbi:hypothetical protein GWK47_045682 [Chionoecetes opilio]|uniref:Uncharacterized protein n=1 Tax=Chionoecetes opilio TaxID=41210 RepID=A0A8J4YEK7_CHIOP|nr:hypothetical protein GWK47_045682 [Chionoecetes opilio]